VSETFDFIVVGAGSAGAVVASRLCEDPSCRVLLVEAGHAPPPEELIPGATSTLQLNPATDWMCTADAGGAGKGLIGGRSAQPRGKMLGGSSGINFMAYVRGHPGDFDAWAAGGASGWSYEEVLPYFRKSEGLAPSAEIDVDAAAHGVDGPLGVSVRAPVLEGARRFVDAAVAAGIPRGDYNGRDRGGPTGVSSLFQTTTRDGRRSSTYHAFLEGDVEARPNLRIVTGAHATRVLLDEDNSAVRGVEYRGADGQAHMAVANREVVLSCGAYGTPHLLLRSGIGPREALEGAGVACRVDSPEVGKHLKDHLMVPLFFPAPGSGISVAELGVSFGPDALRAPAGPLPADPADDDALPPELAGLKVEAERRIGEWASAGTGLVASSLCDATAFFSTGLSAPHSHDGQVHLMLCGLTVDYWRANIRIDPEQYLADPETALALDAESILLLPSLLQPHSEGEVVLAEGDPQTDPEIRMNYYADPQDLEMMRAITRRTLEIAAHWPGEAKLGPLNIPPLLAERHGHVADTEPSDALLDDLARHYSLTIYHPTSTCRIGSVVDERLRVLGVDRLRIADASVMPDIVSGNTNAACIMIGEKAAEMIAVDHGIPLAEFVG
jgi:choline dehydrogenase-like flavoprotein